MNQDVVFFVFALLEASNWDFMGIYCNETVVKGMLGFHIEQPERVQELWCV